MTRHRHACTGFHTRFDDFVRHYGAGWLTPWYSPGCASLARAPTPPGAHQTNCASSCGGLRRVHLLRRAVDTQLFPPGAPRYLRAQWQATADTPVVVVYVGRIAPKRTSTTMCALPPSSATAGRALRVGGRWSGLRKSAGNPPDFLFVGTLHGEALARHYASADLFLFPSLARTFERHARGHGLRPGHRGLRLRRAAREHIDDGISVPPHRARRRRRFVLAARSSSRVSHLRRAGRRGPDAVLPLQPPSVITAVFAPCSN